MFIEHMDKNKTLTLKKLFMKRAFLIILNELNSLTVFLLRVSGLMILYVGVNNGVDRAIVKFIYLKKIFDNMH